MEYIKNQDSLDFSALESSKLPGTHVSRVSTSYRNLDLFDVPFIILIKHNQVRV